MKEETEPPSSVLSKAEVFKDQFVLIMDRYKSKLQEGEQSACYKIFNTKFHHCVISILSMATRI
jgi:hypothetical protein